MQHDYELIATRDSALLNLKAGRNLLWGLFWGSALLRPPFFDSACGNLDCLHIFEWQGNNTSGTNSMGTMKWRLFLQVWTPMLLWQ